MKMYDRLCAVILGSMLFSFIIFWILMHLSTGQLVCLYLACIVFSSAVWTAIIKTVTKKE
jgi:uncharacterized membrane protein YccC